MLSPSSSNGHEKNKRRNAPLSCAECRRLKLRCSRVFPCASCVKKGCAAICPEGSLTTGKGNRFVLANTEVLHEKISVLSTRVRQLEDALAGLYAESGAQEPHPLLTPDLLQLKRPLEREPPEPPKETDVETAEAIDAVGSLSINESGHTKFFGTTANAWYLLQNEEGGDDETENPEIVLPTDGPWLSHIFPLATNSTSDTRMNVRHFLLSSLPEVGQARHLVEIYYRHGGWMYTPIPETELYSTVFSRIYDQGWPEDQDPNDSHRLAVLYMVFAVGALMDLDKPYLSLEATQYYQLARAALSLDSILEHQSIPALQALVLMCHFMFLSFRDGPRWALMGLVVKLAQSLGLHRDSGKWNLSPEETFRRRSLMWEVYTYDSWQSLTFGRPPSFALAFIDTQMAELDVQPKAQGEEVEMSYAAWKHRFASRCLSVVHEQGFGARTPSYKTIQELDKKVRSFYVPPSLRVPGFGGAKMMELTPSIELTMQRHTVFAIREISIFYLHRGFFARAIEDSQEDPLGSKYAPSVLAAYTSACTFVGLVKSLHSQQPQLTERLWFFFTHVFSCAIVLGSIAAKCPGLPFARSALMNLDSACNLFEVVRENDRAAKVIPVLRKLKARAVIAMNNAPSTHTTPLSRMSPGGSTVKAEDEELAALGGKTRLVARKSSSQPSSPQDNAQQNTPSPQGSPVQQYTPDHIPLMPPPGMQHVNGMESPATRWAPYPTQSPGEMYYPQYPIHNGQWSPDSDYAPQMHSPTIPMAMGSMQYPAYEAMQPVANSYIPTHSPMESPMQTVPDPNASWQNLFAQFNQP